MDYKKLGLKCGLEIHQQLDTAKLFCSCPSIIRDDAPDFEIKRHLRAIAGETGKIDAAALAETKKKKHFIYQGYHDSTCLVELDEEPPHAMNNDALSVVLQVAKMLDSKVVDNIRVMRKTVVDGSNTTGFQRTALVGLGGELSGVGIETVCVEEDACKIVERSATHDTYNLSRLGIPLIEIATAPDIKSPEQAKDVAQELGMLLRSTGKVKRGIGTIRQDLNVSIKDGLRVEMKGVQDLKLIPTYVEFEVLRQKNLLDIFVELKKKSAKVDAKASDLTDVFNHTQAKIISSALKKSGAVLAIKLEGFAGYLGREIQPGRRLGTEFSDYAKTQGVRGLFHSDELPHYGITEQEVSAVKSALKIKEDDAFILIADTKDVARRSMQAVIDRASHFGLLKEVRQAQPNGTTSYMRPMPGSNRMYPETDIPSITPYLDDVQIPELITDKQARYVREYNISDDLASQLAKGGFPFDEDVKAFPNVAPTLIAECFIAVQKDLKKRFNIETSQDVFESRMREVLAKLNKNEISSQAIIDILVAMNKGSVDWSKFKPMDEKGLDKIIQEVIAADPKAPMGALMGAAMKKLGGKADGKLVMQRLKKFMK